MGHSFCVWETFPLLVTFLSFWLCSQSHVDALSSHITHLSPSKGFPPRHRNIQCLWLSQVLFRTFSVIFPSLSPIQSFFLDSLRSTGCRAVCLCVWASFRPPVGQAGSALRPGCCWRSTQAFRHSPSLEGQDCPSITQAPPCPRTPAPPQLYKEKGGVPGRGEGERDRFGLCFLLTKKKKKKRILMDSGEAHRVTVQYADATEFMHTKHQD